jgi:hypothetical protein
MPILLFLAGLLLVVVTLNGAVRTLVLPRGETVLSTALIFTLTRLLFRPWTSSARDYAERDRVMALYAPITLLLLPIFWLVWVLVGYTAMFWAVGVRPWSAAFKVSGSSLLTLGFADVITLDQTILAFTEAALGLGLVALLIAYLPSMYAAFSRRERAVSLLEVRAGSPPSAIEMIVRAHRIRNLNYLNEEWERWEEWFAELEESHTSLAALVFFRSPQHDRSWVTASGAVLDAAALMASTIDVPHDARTDLCIRAGYLALRKIADFFGIAYDPDPKPDDPITIARDEFDAAYDQLAASDVPLRSDREQAWQDFAGWRVNYDTVLVALAALTMAPYAPWSSDRSHRRAQRKRGLRMRLGGA